MHSFILGPWPQFTDILSVIVCLVPGRILDSWKMLRKYSISWVQALCAHSWSVSALRNHSWDVQPIQELQEWFYNCPICALWWLDKWQTFCYSLAISKVYEFLLTYAILQKYVISNIVFPFISIQMIQIYYNMKFLTSFMASKLSGPKIVMHLEIRKGYILNLRPLMELLFLVPLIYFN